ncbi:MAG: hypothetical protein LBP56_01790 [Odoribacteraceae bacterium]|jgi:hypothetical protein|nr:hypothetical protein [Odoribacteraceae bacterium]
MNRIKYIAAVFAFATWAMAVRGQAPQSGPDEQPGRPASIVMRGEVHKNKVLVRWAPTDAKAWRLLNEYGARLEKVTVVRAGVVLDEPLTELLAECLRPEESEAFKCVATEYPYAAIIAQAVFGESFAVSGMSRGDVEAIIALSEELQQRYLFSLYAADLCFPAAVAAGWGWEDNEAKEDERYLYRVTPLVPPEQMEIAGGALFVDGGRVDRFPPPLDFSGRFMDGTVLLSWNARTQQALYNAYILERSIDGVHFISITDPPVTKIDASEENDRIFYADSIQNDIEYHYRLVALTPFGTKSAYGDTIRGVGRAELQVAPLIVRASPDSEDGMVIAWEFDPAYEALIESFTLERSDDDAHYTDYLTPLPKEQRSVTLHDLPLTNYFTVAANSLTGKRVRSFSVLVQPIDTLPPAVPVGLTAIADTTGVVRLSWQANKDRGKFGYRLYRGQTAEEEMIPLNDIAIQDTVYIDSVDARSLNREVYYAITALNERYTQSDRSGVVEVIKPEVIPPTAPFIRQIRVEDGRNVLCWVSGGESVLAGYDIWRGSGAEFEMITRISDAAVREWQDDDVENGRTYIYRVCSRSEGGLVSEPSPDYKVKAINKSGANPAVTFHVTFVKGRVNLAWEVTTANVTGMLLYKKAGGGSFGLFREGLDRAAGIEDSDVMSGVNYEYMLVVKSNSAPPATIIKSIAL